MIKQKLGQYHKYFLSKINLPKDILTYIAEYLYVRLRPEYIFKSFNSLFDNNPDFRIIEYLNKYVPQFNFYFNLSMPCMGNDSKNLGNLICLSIDKGIRGDDLITFVKNRNFDGMFTPQCDFCYCTANLSTFELLFFIIFNNFKSCRFRYDHNPTVSEPYYDLIKWIIFSHSFEIIIDKSEHNYVLKIDGQHILGDGYIILNQISLCSNLMLYPFVREILKKISIIESDDRTPQNKNSLKNSLLHHLFITNFQPILIDCFMENKSITSKFKLNFARYVIMMDNKKIKILYQQSKHMRAFLISRECFYEFIRTRNTKIIKFLWTRHKTKLIKLHNIDGLNILEYAFKNKGLAQNIITLFLNSRLPIRNCINFKNRRTNKIFV